MMRLVGGTIAGTAADRWGRKLPLMLSVLWFSIFAFLSGFSTSYAMLFALRALFGLGMGGEWAAGMPLVFEHWPARLRGLASGLMLGGWYWGYLLAAVTFQFVYPLFSGTPDLAWRVMFWVAIVPALFTLWIRARVPESPIWLERAREAAAPRRRRRSRSCASSSAICIGTTIHTTLVIGSFMCIYYSVNYWYPTFLRDSGRTTLPYLAAFNIGAIAGTAIWGRLSETTLGRRGAATVTHAARASRRCRSICTRQLTDAGSRRPDDGILRHGHLGHGARLHQRAVPHRCARCRRRILLSRRSGDRRR